MFRQLLCLSLLFFGTLAAEHIDDIESQFSSDKTWELREDVEAGLRAFWMIGKCGEYCYESVTIQFPSDRTWELQKEVENALGKAQIYEAREDFFFDSSQHFVTQLFPTPFELHDIESIEQLIQIACPFLELHYNLLHTDEDSQMLELYGYDDDDIAVYILIRILRSGNGTVVLTYTLDCENESKAEIRRLRDQWIPILQGTKLLYHYTGVIPDEEMFNSKREIESLRD